MSARYAEKNLIQDDLHKEGNQDLLPTLLRDQFKAKLIR